MYAFILKQHFSVALAVILNSNMKRFGFIIFVKNAFTITVFRRSSFINQIIFHSIKNERTTCQENDFGKQFFEFRIIGTEQKTLLHIMKKVTKKERLKNIIILC